MTFVNSPHGRGWSWWPRRATGSTVTVRPPYHPPRRRRKSARLHSTQRLCRAPDVPCMRQRKEAELLRSKVAAKRRDVIIAWNRSGMFWNLPSSIESPAAGCLPLHVVLANASKHYLFQQYHALQIRWTEEDGRPSTHLCCKFDQHLQWIQIKTIQSRRCPAFYNEVIFSLPGKSSRSLTLRALRLKNFLPFSRDLKGFTAFATPTRLSTFAWKDLQPCKMANRTKITNHLVEYIWKACCGELHMWGCERSTNREG